MNQHEFLEYFRIAWQNLTHRKKRAYLTIVGIFIGIMAVTALVSLGQGLQKGVDAEFAKLGSDKIFVQPRSAFGGSENAPNPLTDDDLRVVRSVNGVKESLGTSYTSAQVTWGDQAYYPIIASYPEEDTGLDLYRVAWSGDIAEGRELTSKDTYKAVVGQSYKDRTLFRETLSLGSTIFINNKSFTVVGFRKEIGNDFDDTQVLISFDAYREIVDPSEEYSYIIVQTQPGLRAKDVAERITKELRQERGLKAGNEDFDAQTTEDFQNGANQVLGIINVVLTGIAMISLLVGAVGVMNTMYTAVLERTKEIGIMKAVGATNRAILTIFLIESGLLGVMGGAVGVSLGLAISFATAGIAGKALGTTLVQAYFSWWLVLGGLLFSFLIGSLAGFLPARQAAKMKPVDSLRYE